MRDSEWRLDKMTLQIQVQGSNQIDDENIM